MRAVAIAEGLPGQGGGKPVVGHRSVPSESGQAGRPRGGLRESLRGSEPRSRVSFKEQAMFMSHLATNLDFGVSHSI